MLEIEKDRPVTLVLKFWPGETKMINLFASVYGQDQSAEFYIDLDESVSKVADYVGVNLENYDLLTRPDCFPECPGKKFVRIYPDSHWEAALDWKLLNPEK